MTVCVCVCVCVCMCVCVCVYVCESLSLSQEEEFIDKTEIKKVRRVRNAPARVRNLQFFFDLVHAAQLVILRHACVNSRSL